MMKDDKFALFYWGTIYRKKSSRYAVELLTLKLPRCSSRVYFFDHINQAESFIRINNAPPKSPLLFDLSDDLFDDLFPYKQFGVFSVLKPTGLFKIGSGSRSEVYLYNKYWVIKRINVDSDGAYATIQIPYHYRERLALPKINWVESDINGGCIFVERLYQINYSLFYGTTDATIKMNDPLFFIKRGFKLTSCLKKDHPLYEVFYKVLVTHRYLKWMGHKVTIDITHNNIMAREDGKLILNDVIGSILPPNLEGV